MSSRSARTSSTGRPIGSGRFQSTYRFPGSTGQASSPQPIVTTTSAHSTSSCSIPRGLPVGEIDAELAHHLDDLRVHFVLRARARRARLAAQPLVQRLRHLRPARIADADEVRARQAAHAAALPTGPPSANASSPTASGTRR